MNTCWFVCSSRQLKTPMMRLSQRITRQKRMHFIEDPNRLRSEIYRVSPRNCSVIVGFSERGVSDINICAALLKDGCARVILVGRDLSGSFRSRAHTAGITEILDVLDLSGSDLEAFSHSSNALTHKHPSSGSPSRAESHKLAIAKNIQPTDGGDPPVKAGAAAASPAQLQTQESSCLRAEESMRAPDEDLACTSQAGASSDVLLASRLDRIERSCEELRACMHSLQARDAKTTSTSDVCDTNTSQDIDCMDDELFDDEFDGDERAFMLASAQALTESMSASAQGSEFAPSQTSMPASAALNQPMAPPSPAPAPAALQGNNSAATSATFSQQHSIPCAPSQDERAMSSRDMSLAHLPSVQMPASAALHSSVAGAPSPQIFGQDLSQQSQMFGGNTPTPTAPLISFVSGRGGMGKTALCACMASLAAHMGFRVALLDFDLACGNLSLCFGDRQVSDLARLLDNSFAGAADTSCVSDEALAKVGFCISDKLCLWGPVERAEMQELVSPYLGQLMNYVRRTFDIVFVDTSTTFTDAVAQAVQASARVMIVHDDLPDALHGLAKTSALAVRLGVARGRIARIENFSNPHSRVDLDFGRNEVGLEGAESYKVLDGGMNVHELMATGHVLELVDSKNNFVRSTQALLTELVHDLSLTPAHSLLDQTVPAPRKRKIKLALFRRDKEAV